MIAEARTFVPITTGSYAAKVQGVESTEGQYGPQWRWTFNLGTVEDVEGEMREVTLTYYTPNYVTSKNKLGKMLAALGIPTDEDFDSDSIIGRTVTLTVIEATRQDGSVGNNIEAILPPRKKAKVDGTKAAAAEPPVVSGLDDDDEIPF